MSTLSIKVTLEDHPDSAWTRPVIGNAPVRKGSGCITTHLCHFKSTFLKWHHRYNGHEHGQTLGDGEGQGSLVCCSPWGYKESDMTERLN